MCIETTSHFVARSHFADVAAARSLALEGGRDVYEVAQELIPLVPEEVVRFCLRLLARTARTTYH